jgi:hypothetical protein
MGFFTGFEYSPKGHFQNSGHPEKRIERGHAHPTLNVADHLLGKASFPSKFRHRDSLAQTLLLQEFRNLGANELACAVAWHAYQINALSLTKT